MKTAAEIMATTRTTAWEDIVLAEANTFRMQRGGFRNAERHTVGSLEEAVRYAQENKGSRPWMIYAVTPEGRDAHIVNV